MSVIIVGMSHRSAPVTVLEQLSMDEATRGKAAQLLVQRASLSEAMVVSTCNRIEVYAVTNSFHTGVTDIVDVLTQLSGMDVMVLRRHLYVRYADAAAEHMFAVTSGLDSMVLGEQQIIGQVRSSYLQAHELGTAGPILHLLAQCALHTGKRVHTETDIDAAGSSMVSFAFSEAISQLGLTGNAPLAGKTAVVLGAGAMASLAASHLGKLGVAKIIVANRTRSRAENLAQHSVEAGVAAQVVSWDERCSVYPDVDVIVSACGAGMHTVTAADFGGHTAASMAGATVVETSRPSRVCVDLSMPRDISDDVAAIPGMALVNIERLNNARFDPAAATHRKALAIIAEELGSYSSAQRVRDVVPAVAALRRHAAGLIDSEMTRLEGKTPQMSESDRAEVTRTVNRIVDKLLHQPTVRVKELAAHSGSVSYNSALQELFGLAEQPPARVANIIHIDPASLLHGGRQPGTVDSALTAAALAENSQLAGQMSAEEVVAEHDRVTRPSLVSDVPRTVIPVRAVGGR